MKRILALALPLLLALPAAAQSPARGGPPDTRGAPAGIAPGGNGARLTIMAAGGNTPRPLADWLADRDSVKGFGAVGNGTANDLAAMNRTPPTAMLPPGIYYTGSSITSLTRSYRGGMTGGRLKTLERGVERLGPRNLWVIGAPQTTHPGFSENAGTTSFDYDDSGQFFNGLVRITGADTLGRPRTGYHGNIPAAAFYLQYNNSSGWNQATDSNNGRTGTGAFRIRINNTGQGDVGAFGANGYVSGTRAGATSFLANPASVLFSGANSAGSDGVYLDTLEFALDDHGHDVAGVGQVFTFKRTNATGARDAFWAGLRFQSLSITQGGKPLDADLSLAGPTRIGIDMSRSQFYELNATTPSFAAMTLGAGARIYGNSTNTGKGGFPNATVLGDAWLAYEAGGGWNMVAGGRPVLTAGAAGVSATALRVTAPTVPAAATDACARGQISYDSSYVYVCVAANTWKRAALAGW